MPLPHAIDRHPCFVSRGSRPWGREPPVVRGSLSDGHVDEVHLAATLRGLRGAGDGLVVRLVAPARWVLAVRRQARVLALRALVDGRVERHPVAAVEAAAEAGEPAAAAAAAVAVVLDAAAPAK